MSDAIDELPVSVERSDGRILTGVGADVDDLKATMARHAPPEDSPTVAAGEPAAPPSVDAPAGDPPVKKTRGQARFDQLTGEREAARREADAAKQEAADLKAKLAALESTARVPAPAATPGPASAATATPAPEKFTFPAYDAYVASHPEATWDDWQDAKMDAHSDWKIAKRDADIDARVQRGIEADRTTRSHVSTVEGILAKGRAAYPDFDAVREAVASVPFTPSKIQYLLKQPTAEHLIYQIAKDPTLTRRLSALDEVEFGAEVRALAPGAVTPAPAVPVSIAPAPYQPVGSGTRTSVPASNELIKGTYDFDKSGYRERRAAERGLARAR